MSKLIGLLKWYNHEKGFGVIAAPLHTPGSPTEFFLHHSVISATVRSLTPGIPIVFVAGFHHNKDSALHAETPSSLDDVRFALACFDKLDRVQLETGKPSILSAVLRATINLIPATTLASAMQSYLATIEDSQRPRLFLSLYGLLSELDVRLNDKLATAIVSQIQATISENVDEATSYELWRHQLHDSLRPLGSKVSVRPPTVDCLRAHLSDWSSVKIGFFMRLNHPDVTQLFLQAHLRELETSCALQDLNTAHALARVLPDSDDKATVLNHILALSPKPIDNAIRSAVEQMPATVTTDCLASIYAAVAQIPPWLPSEEIQLHKQTLMALLDQRLTEGTRLHLWVEGLVEGISPDSIYKAFTTMDAATRLKVFSRLPTLDAQTQCLRASLADGLSFESMMQLIESHFLNNKVLRYGEQLSSKFQINSVWKDDNAKSLLSFGLDCIRTAADPSEHNRLYLLGLTDSFDVEHLHASVDSLKATAALKFLDSTALSASLKADILIAQIKSKSMEPIEVLSQGQKFLQAEDYLTFEEQVVEILGAKAHLQLWLQYWSPSIFPLTGLEEFLQSEELPYLDLLKALHRLLPNSTRLATMDSFGDVDLQSHYRSPDTKGEQKALARLTAYLQAKISRLAETPKEHPFRLYYHFNTFLAIQPEARLLCPDTARGPLALTLFSLGLNDNIATDEIILGFHDIPPLARFRSLQRLFYLHRSKQRLITSGELRKLFHADCQDGNPVDSGSTSFNLSVQIAISGLDKLRTTGKFQVESDLLKCVALNAKNNPHLQFQAEGLFDVCEGRRYVESIRGTVQRDKEGDREEFVISFRGYDPDLVAAAKAELPNRRYSPSDKTWRVPVAHESQVNEFKVRHLISFNRRSTPRRILFCEGQASRELDRDHGIPFIWCAGNACFGRSAKIHSQDEWTQYTLLDFIHILGLNADSELRSWKETDGLYFNFVSQINRFCILLEHLYCRDCKCILYPTKEGNFASQRVTTFQCVSRACGSYQKPVYLNHCMNCRNGFIDSRDLAKCPNHWCICSQCGGCCSDVVFERRRETLTITGGDPIDMSEGHKEKGLVFCWKCGQPVNPAKGDVRQEVYVCSAHGEMYGDKRLWKASR